MDGNVLFFILAKPREVGNFRNSFFVTNIFVYKYFSVSPENIEDLIETLQKLLDLPKNIYYKQKSQVEKIFNF